MSDKPLPNPHYGQMLRDFKMACGHMVSFYTPPTNGDILWCSRCDDWKPYGAYDNRLRATCPAKDHKDLLARTRSAMLRKASEHYRLLEGCRVTVHYPEGNWRYTPRVSRQERPKAVTGGPGQKYSVAKIKEARRLRSSGLTASQVGAQVGVSERTIQRWMRFTDEQVESI